MTAPQLISGSPVPPRRGTDITICYDFTAVEATSAVLSVEFEPSSGSMSLSLTAAVPCQTITVPDGADDMVVTDQTGPSSQWARIVLPPL